MKKNSLKSSLIQKNNIASGDFFSITLNNQIIDIFRVYLKTHETVLDAITRIAQHRIRLFLSDILKKLHDVKNITFLFQKEDLQQSIIAHYDEYMSNIPKNFNCSFESVTTDKNITILNRDDEYHINCVTINNSLEPKQVQFLTM